MAILEHPRLETVSSEILSLLRHIGHQDFATRFYLADGTALALQLGHRRSVDLDFFSEIDEIKQDTQKEILDGLRDFTPIIIERAVGNFVLSITDVSVGFFGYGYPLVGAPIHFAGVSLAAPVDVGMMKLDALLGRASRKDFFDLYFIAQTVPLRALFELGATKYPHARDFAMEAVSALTFFENADRDLQPDLFIPVEWEEVKNFFIEQAKILRREWFGF